MEKTNAEPTQMTPCTSKHASEPDSDDLPVKGALTNLSGDICAHCDKQCTETGEQGQCDLCGVWVYAVYDGISKDQYEGVMALILNIENLTYICKLNSCLSSDCNELHSRLAKVEAKLDKTVQEIASRLENHSKAIESIPNSALAVEVKLNEVGQELDTRLDSHRKKLKRCQQMFLILLPQLLVLRLPWLQSREKGKNDSLT